jgi:hypothetical protein
VARRQAGPVAEAVMRAKLTLGMILPSTTPIRRSMSPLWIALSPRMMVSTSLDRRPIIASGASSAARAAARRQQRQGGGGGLQETAAFGQAHVHRGSVVGRHAMAGRPSITGHLGAG